MTNETPAERAAYITKFGPDITKALSVLNNSPTSSRPEEVAAREALKVVCNLWLDDRALVRDASEK